MTKRRKTGLILTILGVVIVTMGATYTLFINNPIGMKNNVAITGDIYLHYNEDPTITLSNMIPMTKEEALSRNDNIFDFTITGKNTSSKDIYYGISLEMGEVPTGKTGVKESDIVTYLTSGENILLDGIRYNDFSGHIYVDKIEAGTTSEISKSYSLRVWLRDGIIVSDTEPNASYTTGEWENLYMSLKVRVDGNLERMNMPLTLEHDNTSTENNKQYFIANVKNYLNPDEVGETLSSNDTMNLEVTSDNSNIAFSYKDSKGNVVTETNSRLNLEYVFTKMENVEVQVFVTPVNDSNTNTDISVKLTKNNEEVYNQLINMNIVGNNYCLNNGFTKLGDCLLVSETLTDNIEKAKTKIATKGEVNLNDTAPSYTYIEQKTSNVSNVATINNNKIYIGDNYFFDEKTGKFTVNTNTKAVVLSSSDIGKYTCANTHLICDVMYKILEVDVSGAPIYKITKADKYTNKIASTLRSEVGLYETEDDDGKSYFYRGDVENNNVLFGGFYWKIIRMNGDGSIRLIYNGTTLDATGDATSINNTTYQYSKRYTDPTYVGYMRGEEFKVQTSKEDTFGYINALTKYYFADEYTFDESTKLFKLSGNISETKTFSEMNSLENNGFKKYPYTCKSTSREVSCPFLIKVNSYINETNVKAQYIAYSSTGLDATRLDNVSSNVKTQLDNWYKTNIDGKRETNGNLLTNYIVDGTFCNDRSFASNNTGNGYSLAPTTTYAAYKRLRSDTNKTATLKCTSNADKFSTPRGKGNAKLEYPIALITADEVALAGAKYGMKNQDYYLRTNGYFWTMTPSIFSAWGVYAIMYFVLPAGNLENNTSLSNSYGIRPVINLRSDVLISQGDGTVENPFELKLA